MLDAVPVPAPMLATAGRPPEDASAWAREMKWDGMRLIAVVRSGKALLYSRTGREVTRSFPEVASALIAMSDGESVIVDGELICPDPATGAPSFARLQSRMHVGAPGAALLGSVPVQLVAFDVLERRGRSLMGVSYVDRRAELAELALSGPAVLTPPFWVDMDADVVLDVARQHNLEGIVSKRLDSVYHPGRSRLWVKSVLRRIAEVVVVGWIPSSGAGGGTIGSLVLGAYNGAAELVPVGHVGTGFTASTRRALRVQLDELSRPDSPLDHRPIRTRGVRWVSAVLVGSIEYREFVDGTLRHPSWRGLRTDIDVRRVRVPP